MGAFDASCVFRMRAGAASLLRPTVADGSHTLTMVRRAYPARCLLLLFQRARLRPPLTRHRVTALHETPPVICLMGPTCSGKTGLAVELVRRFPLEIVSVDSTQVYRGLDIGTAKPDAATRAEAPHRLLDIRDPAEPYSAAEFRDDARAEIEDIHARGRVPLLVGGTMLYFRALLWGLAPLPAADPELRARLEERAEAQGWPALHAELADVDPDTAERLDPRDRQRLQRALEVYELTGIPLSEHHRRHQESVQLSDTHEPQESSFPFRVLHMAVVPEDRAGLHQRIEERFRAMLADGLVDEVAALRDRQDLHPELPALKSVGYRQVWQYLEGELDHARMVERGVVATRQLAKRQLTWLRRWPSLEAFSLEDGSLTGHAADRVAAFLAAGNRSG